jgi:hypothetical protein
MDSIVFQNNSLNSDCTNNLPKCFFLASFLFLLVLATIIGNVFVITTIYLERNLHNHGNYLILSLALTDLLVATLVMPIAAYKEIFPLQNLPSLLCDIWTSLDVLCCTASILHLLAIACDRYFYLTKLRYKNHNTRKHSFKIVSSIWFISLSISIIPHVFGLHSEQCQITKNLLFQFISTLVAFYFPLLAMCFIYWRIYETIKATIRKKSLISSKNALPLDKTLIRLNQGMKKSVSDPKLNDLYIKPHGNLKRDINHFLKIFQSKSSIASSENQHEEQLYTHERRKSCPTRLNQSEFDLENKNLHLKRENFSIRKTTLPTENLSNNKFKNTQLSVREKKRDLSNLQSTIEQKTQFIFVDEKSSTRRPSIIETAEILSKIRENIKKTKESLSKSSRRHSKHERKAARTLGVVISCFTLCWLPFFIMQMVLAFCQNCLQFLTTYSIVPATLTWLGYSNSCINPIIYTIFSPDFRNAFEKILFRRFKLIRGRHDF